MNRPTDQWLRSLLPTHNGAFPPALADLAGSLLAQSRHRASTLKADEEIARAYACAHIACDRLKTSLNLPPISPLPPIKPQLYKRLYTYLDRVLKPVPTQQASRIEGSSLRSSPAVPARQQKQQQQHAGSPAVVRDRPRPDMRQTTCTTPTRSRFRATATPESAFPPWLRPTVRHVCESLDHTSLAPTVVAGLATIWRGASEKENKHSDDDGEKENDDVWVAAHWTALAAALCYYCAAAWRAGAQKVGGSSSSTTTAVIPGTLDQVQYEKDEKAILEAFRQARAAAAVSAKAGLQDAADWDAASWKDLTRHRFRDALLMVSERQWLQSDWFQDLQARRHETAEEEEVDKNGDEDKDELAWRADSMLQQRYDYLGTASAAAYATWKDGILRRLDDAMVDA